MSIEAEAYARHKNLKLAAAEIGIDWQVLYTRLRQQGVAVTGDKLRYGDDRDKLAATFEAKFAELVPQAESCNQAKWQSKFDFYVSGHKVDIKTSRRHKAGAYGKALRWSFSIKRQSLDCDFMCCFCLGDNDEIEKVLLIPSEFFAGAQLISVACSGASKWEEFVVEPGELAEFFKQMPPKEK